MDLYSAAKRLRDPFVFDRSRPTRLPIAARGLIGDGRSAALVDAFGAIDWLCWPSFDDASVFGGILDEKRGGVTWLRPTADHFESLQHYDPGTNVLETLFTVPGQGIVRLTDFMPWTGDPRLAVHEVHRRVQCVEGRVELEMVFDPRFDYGRTETRFVREEHGLMAQAGTSRMAAVVSGEPSWTSRPEGGMRTSFTLSRGERHWVVLSWSAKPDRLEAYRSYELLRVTRNAWRAWTRRIEYEGPWRHHVTRSALLLKLLIYAPTGAMVAAPTTSLPEWIGGTRNWDYRFTWTRDSAMSIRAANRLGCADEAREFFHFVRDTLEQDEQLQIMYTIAGHAVPDESELSHLAGYAGSGPVRIGNGARDQVQLDTAGALLDAAFLYERAGGTLTLRVWRRLREVVESVARRWREADHGIWEPRDGKRHNVHSKLMSWLALERGARLAPLFGDQRRAQGWRRVAKDVREEVFARGLDAGRSHFVAAYDHDHVDAALLLLPIHGLIAGDDPLTRRTIDRVRSELGQGPFLHRYKVGDGVGGEEGAFILCGFWLSEALSIAGRHDEAQEVFLAHADASNHLGLLAEEVDPNTGDLLGNFPQAFSHLGLINAAARLDDASHQGTGTDFARRRGRAQD